MGRRELGWLLVLLVLLAAPKLLLSASTHDTSIDGGLYTEIAQHVARGEGLVTNVSLYHHGYPSFPHPTAIYPLWPLLYGVFARWFPVPAVGIWLATAFYFTTLCFAFAWGRSLDARELFPAALPGVHVGHVMALVLGLHREFFEFTSWPYTEGLAWTLLMATLWRANRRLERPGLGGGIELGALAALAFLARSQMLLLPVAFGVVALWRLVRDRAERAGWARLLAGLAGACVLLVLPADARLPEGARGAVRAAVVGGARWGAFAVRHEPSPAAGAFACWLLSRADARSRRRRLPYGDQAPWCTRDAWDEVGGVPDWPLMEDWELSRRLHARFGAPRRLAGEVVASGRRAAARPLRTAVAWSIFPTLLRLGVPPERLARWYRR